jgi:NTP pyrophosphatase (non-canonical NTP hydrolase)
MAKPKNGLQNSKSGGSRERWPSYDLAIRFAENLYSLHEFALAVEANAVAHGFRKKVHRPTKANIGTFTSNLHGEVSEFWEAFRKGTLLKSCDKADAMRSLGLPALTSAEEELADIIIRTLDTAASMNINIAKALAVKHAYNVSRPYKHGGKKA